MPLSLDILFPLNKFFLLQIVISNHCKFIPFIPLLIGLLILDVHVNKSVISNDCKFIPFIPLLIGLLILDVHVNKSLN